LWEIVLGRIEPTRLAPACRSLIGAANKATQLPNLAKWNQNSHRRFESLKDEQDTDEHQCHGGQHLTGFIERSLLESAPLLA
jgi:hypothetical protein